MQACILCSSIPVIPLKSPKSREENRFLRCPVCGLIFVPRNFHLTPDDEKDRYMLHENTLSNEGYVGMFLDKIALIRQYCRGVCSVLDYGCGPEPVLAQLLRREGYDCDIYDPYFFPEFPRGSFDLVISTEVFEHMKDISAGLRSIRSLLAPGGYLAIMTSFHDTVADFRGWWYASDPTHICFFSMRTFEWISEKFAFNIIYTNRKNFIIMQVK